MKEKKVGRSTSNFISCRYSQPSMYMYGDAVAGRQARNRTGRQAKGKVHTGADLPSDCNRCGHLRSTALSTSPTGASFITLFPIFNLSFANCFFPKHPIITVVLRCVVRLRLLSVKIRTRTRPPSSNHSLF